MPISASLHQKRLTVILVRNEGAKGSQQVVLTGTAKWGKGGLFLDRGPGLPLFPIPDDMLHRVRPVASALRGILDDADYTIMLNVAPAPEQISVPLRVSGGRAEEYAGRILECPALV